MTATLATRSQMNRDIRHRRRLYFGDRKIKMIAQVEGPVRNRLRRGNMDELIGRLAVEAGIDRSVAKKIGIIADLIIPGFLRSEGPSAEFCSLVDRNPGTETVIAASRSGSVAWLRGNGLIAAGNKLISLGLGMLGLGMVKFQTLARELLQFSRDKTGADQMGEIIVGTPGLSRFA